MPGETWEWTVAEHPDPDLVLDLALGHLAGPQRDAVASHLGDCAACRADFDDLSAAVESTLAAVPRTEPRPGFAASVLDRLDPPVPAALPGRPQGGRPGRGRPGMPAWVGVAAAAVVGLGVGTVGTLALRDGLDGAPGTEVPAAQPLAASGSALTTADGTVVGTVSRSYGEAGPMLVVDITGGEPGRSYLCRLRMADGATEDVGRWTLSPARPNSWVVADPGAEAVELVSDSGNVWSSASL